MSRPMHRIPGHDVDRIDVAAGLRELSACGYNEPETVLVVEYALKRWARGEEEAAQRGAIDQAFRGISLTCWLRVLSAARARAEETAASAAAAAASASQLDQISSAFWEHVREDDEHEMAKLRQPTGSDIEEGEIEVRCDSGETAIIPPGHCATIGVGETGRFSHVVERPTPLEQRRGRAPRERRYARSGESVVEALERAHREGLPIVHRRDAGPERVTLSDLLRRLRDGEVGSVDGLAVLIGGREVPL